MDEYSCEICFTEFDEDKILPKVLECGHSYCSQCIEYLIHNKKDCPKCKKTISYSNETYPTNFSLLSVVSSMKNLKVKKSNLSELQALRNDVKEKRNFLLLQIHEESHHASKLEKTLTKINEMLEHENDLLLKDKVSDLIKEAKEDLVCVEKVLNFKVQSKPSPTLRLSDVENTHQLFRKISSKVYQGEDVYVTEKVCNQIKYGKVSIWGKMLLVHSLTLTEVDKDSITILLDDFKKCVTKHNFNTFLKLPMEEGGVMTVIIKVLDSLLSSRFIKLCTGENEFSYKGLTYFKGSSNREFNSVLVASVGAKETEVPGKYEYDINSYCWKNFHKNEILIERYSNGGFEIFKNLLPNTNYTSVVGRVVSSEHLITKLRYGSDTKIVDSGIAFCI